jgi:hypothetical protein
MYEEWGGGCMKDVGKDQKKEGWDVRVKKDKKSVEV